MKSPDQICGQYADAGVKVTVTQMDNGSILVEGNKDGLMFLSELLAAQASFEGDDGFQLSPNGAGSALFTDAATLGLYIHRAKR